MNPSGIYIIFNTKSRKLYIGQSQNIYTRWGEHVSCLRGGYHKNPHLQAAWNKYGEKAFRLYVLEYCPVEKLDERENHFLGIYIPKGVCYNVGLCATSSMRGRTHSPETRWKLSLIARAKRKQRQQAV